MADQDKHDVSGVSGGQRAGVDARMARELIDQARTEGVSLTGPDGLLRRVTKTVLESALNTELDEHLGYEKGAQQAKTSSNERNGTSSKTVRTDVGQVRVDVPRDREGSFEPQVVPKYARRIEGFDEMVISLYAKGLTTGEIQAHLAEIYGAQVSREMISKITDKVLDDLQSWQARPLDRVYPVVLIDAIHVKVRQGSVANRPVYDSAGEFVACCARGRGGRLVCWFDPSEEVTDVVAPQWFYTSSG